MSIIRYPFFHLKKRAVIIREAKRQAPKSRAVCWKKGKIYGKESKPCRTPALGKSDVGSIYQQYVSGAVRRFSGCLHVQLQRWSILKCPDGKRCADEPELSGRKLYGRSSVSLPDPLFCDGCISGRKFPGALPVCKEAALAAGTSRGGNCDPCDRRIYSVFL